MIDKVKKGLGLCSASNDTKYCWQCPYNCETHCIECLTQDTLNILTKFQKENEALKAELASEEYSGNIGNQYRFVKFDSCEDAELVLEKAKNILEDQGLLTVSDYVQLLELHPSAASYDYGWAELNNAYVYAYVHYGKRIWCIHMPEPVHIEHVN